MFVPILWYSRMLRKKANCVEKILLDSGWSRSLTHLSKLACYPFPVRAAAHKGNIVKFGQSRCWIRNRTGKLYGMGSLVNNLYQLDCAPNITERASIASEQRSNVDLWHQQLGHLNGQQLGDIARKKLATGITQPKTTELSFCKGCIGSHSSQWELITQQESYN